MSVLNIPLRKALQLKLFKIGALVKVSARRVKFALPTACPYANEWRLAA